MENKKLFIEKIKKSSVDQLCHIIYDVLSIGSTEFFNPMIGYEDPTVVFKSLIKEINDFNLILTIKKSISRLYRNIDIENENPDIIAKLFQYIADFKILNLYEDMISLANDGTLKNKGISFGTSDLHSYLLNAIASNGFKKGAFSLFTKDITIKKYAPICYQALWENKSSRAITYLPIICDQFIDDDLQISYFPFMLDTFMDSVHDLNSISGYFLPQAINVVKETRKIFFLLDSLKVCNYCFHLTGDNYFVQYEDLKSKKYPQVIINKTQRESVMTWYRKNEDQLTNELLEKLFRINIKNE